MTAWLMLGASMLPWIQESRALNSIQVHENLIFLLDAFKILHQMLPSSLLMYDFIALLEISWNMFTNLETFVTWSTSFIQAPYHPSNPGRRLQLHRPECAAWREKVPVANSVSMEGIWVNEGGMPFRRIMYFKNNTIILVRLKRELHYMITDGGIYFPRLNHDDWRKGWV